MWTRSVRAWSVGIILALCWGAGLAQNYPTRQIRMITPFAPGATTDLLSRIICAKFAEAWGQNCITDNRPGATGMIGADLAAKAPPDGYTLVNVISSHVVHPALVKKVPFHPVNDFTPVILLAATTNILIVHPSVPVNDVAQFVAFAKRQKLLPEVPTMIESGYKDYVANEWWAILGPAGVPKDIVAKLNAEIQRIMKQPDVLQRIDARGVEYLGGTPEELGAFLRSESARWSKVLQDAGIKPE